MEKLLRVLQQLVDAGNTVVAVIESTIWISWRLRTGSLISGPRGGDGGGRLTVQGAPEVIVGKFRQSHTGRFLKDFMATREVE